MHSDVICSPNHTIRVVEDLVHHSLEDVVGTGWNPEEMHDVISQAWYIKDSQQQ